MNAGAKRLRPKPAELLASGDDGDVRGVRP